MARSVKRSQKAIAGIGAFAIFFAMLHFGSSIRMMDLAARLGIHRVSFARIARTRAIPGLVRTATGRWRVDDMKSFETFADQYRAEVAGRCGKLVRFNAEKERQLMAGIRFHEQRFPSDTEIADRNKREIERLRSPGIGDSYTTTDLAKILRITSQAVRNLRDKIPGAKVVGQRLRFEKCNKLAVFLKTKQSPNAAGFRVRTKPALGHPAQDVMTSVLKGSESICDDRATCVDEGFVAGDGQSTFLAQLGFRRRRTELLVSMMGIGRRTMVAHAANAMIVEPDFLDGLIAQNFAASAFDAAL
jgi:hypothetical protein